MDASTECLLPSSINNLLPSSINNLQYILIMFLFLTLFKLLCMCIVLVAIFYRLLKCFAFSFKKKFTLKESNPFLLDIYKNKLFSFLSSFYLKLADSYVVYYYCITKCIIKIIVTTFLIYINPLFTNDVKDKWLSFYKLLKYQHAKPF